MSSTDVRTGIMQFLDSESEEENIVDLTSRFEEIKELLAEEEIGPKEEWVGIEFVGDTEDPITVGATNTKGKYREFGSIFFHIVAPARMGAGRTLLTRCEALIDLMRGQRIGSIVIESVTPPRTQSGATLQFEGGFMSHAFVADYYFDRDL